MFSLSNELPVSFYFRVDFIGLAQNVSFKEVSGLTVEMEVEGIREGGLNEYEYKLPKQIKHTNLTLKRALSAVNDIINYWLKISLENDFMYPIHTVNLIISLLNHQGDPLRVWRCTDAYPVKLEIGNFDSQRNEVMIETIELAYKKITRIK